MITYEYRTVSAWDLDSVNTLGAQGWRVVQVLLLGDTGPSLFLLERIWEPAA